MNQKKKVIYYYPNTSKSSDVENNPYTVNFMNGLSSDFFVINRDAPTALGLLDVFKKIFKIDIVVLNWVEDVPNKKYGTAQAILLVLLLVFKKALNVKIVWVLHNKISHAKSRFWIKKFLVQLLVSKADMILTHSREGIRFVSQFSNQAAKKIFFFHHPVDCFSEKGGTSEEPVYDILIWGKMNPYKGIDEFLAFLDEQGLLSCYRILIRGRFPSNQFFQKCNKYSRENIIIENAFIDDEQLEDLINASRIILFPYVPDSILSSGALMKSLNSNAVIVGPDTAAFSDLAEEGCIKVYHGMGSLAQILDESLENLALIRSVSANRQRFFEENNWTVSLNRLNKRMVETLFSI